MAAPRKTQIVITANAETAKKVLAVLDSRIESIKRRMQQLDVNTAAGRKEFNRLNKELVSYNSAAAQNIKNTDRIKHAIDNLSKTSLNDLKRALAAAKQELGKMSASDKGLKSMQNNVKTLQGQIDKLTGSTKAHGGAWQTAIKNLTAYVGLFGAFNTLKQKLTDIINLNLKFSDQLADIRKVSGWAMGDVDELSKRLAKIDTRNSIQQLNDLAYQGAKLGIGKYGVDGLTRFAEATAQIRMALHEDMGDEAIAQLAKMAEVMHDMDNLGVSKALLASGSAIFKLGATTTATGSNIMEFSKRLLGLGRTADLTTPQILALGSAADSMALMPEVASTAFNKFITTLQSKYAQVAQAVGMNQERLKSLLDQHKTMDAIVEVLEHMRNMGGLDVLAPIMGDLGSEGARLTNVFASMASNVDMLKEHLATSTEEFEKATAVTAEFDIQNETAQALMERASNIWEKTFVNSENAAGGVRDVARAWYDMTKAITESGSFLLEAGASLKVLLWSIQGLIGAIPALINGLVFLGTVKLASWTGWSVAFNAATASATRYGTALVNLVGIQTASQKSALATAQSNLASAEAMMVEAHEAIALAQIKHMQAATDEEVIAAESALSAATTNVVAAQQALATAMGEVAALTGVEIETLARDADTKLFNSLHTKNLWADHNYLAESEGVVTAATTAQTAAIERDTAAKATNTATSKNLKLAWGALVFIGLVAVIDKLYENFKKLNEQKEKNKEVTDKIANGLATANQEYEEACKNLKVLYGELERNWMIEDERKRLIGEINSRYGEYAGNLVDEATKVGDLTKSYQDATDALREYYFYKQKETLKADLVLGAKHEGDVALIKLGNVGDGSYGEKVSRTLLEGAVKEYMKTGATDVQITEQIFEDFYGRKAPGNYYMDLNKMPLIGGFFPKDTFRSTDQEAFQYLREFVKSRVVAFNNENTINHYFPGEWHAPERRNRNNNTGSGSSSGLRPAAPERPENEEDPLVKAKKELTEFRAKIMAFYQQQISYMKEQLMADGTMDEEAANALLKPVERKMWEAVSAAEETFVLGNEAWAKFKEDIDDDMKDISSFGLLEEIKAEDVLAIRALAEKGRPKGWKAEKGLISWINKKGKPVVGRGTVGWASRGLKPEDEKELFFARMLYETSKDDDKQISIALKQQQKRYKELMEHDYTGIVKDKSVSGLMTSGLVEIDAENIQRDKQQVMDMLEKARQQIVDVMASGGDKDEIISLLGITDSQKALKPILESDEEDFRLFYLKLIQYNDEYVEAMKKRSDEVKKVVNYMWSLDPARQQLEEQVRLVGDRNSVRGAQPTFGETLGFRDIQDNPEVLLWKYKKELAKEYYEYVEAHTDDERLLKEAREGVRKATMEQIEGEMKLVKERIKAIDGFMQPTYDAIEGLGDAWAKFRESTEEGQEAMLSNLRNFIKQYAVMMIKGLAEQAKTRVGNRMAVKRIAEDNNIEDAELSASTKKKKFKKSSTKVEEATPVSADVYDENGNVTGEKPSYIKNEEEPTSPVDAQIDIDNALLDEARLFHEQMLEEEADYQDVLEKIRNATTEEEKKNLLRDYSNRLREEKQYNARQAMIREQGFAALKKLSLAGWQSLLKSEEESRQQKLTLAENAENEQTNIEQQNQQQRLANQQIHEAESIGSYVNKTVGDVLLGIAGGSAKTVEELGWWGIPLVGVISAAMMGLLNYALSFIGKGGKSGKVSNAKLVSGMLTYDQGNVQDLHPFFDKDGNMYWATENDTTHRGVSLLTTPTATTINGRPSLVAENGPELVIGRETTKAMMQNNPALLRALYQYDKHHSGRTAYDRGNVSELASAGNLPDASAAGTAAIVQRDPEMVALMTLLLQRLNEPISAKIDMYGRGNLYDSMTKANQFMKGKS